jgi:3-methyl-2-oxobutanoate hydroxymethyltransferase
MTTGQEDRQPKRVTVPWLKAARDEDRRIVMVTGYDAPSARIADAAGVDAILVGDSIGSNVLGYARELPVTMDDIVRATQAVSRGAERALVIADLPFGSYQVGDDDAMRNAVRLIKEGGAHAVKLEGGLPVLPLVKRMTDAGIPVVGHLGYTPQSTHALGGAKVQGKRREEAQFILDSARGLQTAGAFCIVLELIPIQLARTVTHSLSIPTIGIGSGPYCDGQVQIWHDVLGLGGARVYRHVKRYAELGAAAREALSLYAAEVRGGAFPTAEHAVSMKDEELNDLDNEFAGKREDVNGEAVTLPGPAREAHAAPQAPEKRWSLDSTEGESL